MKYNFSFLNKLGPQWKKVVCVLEESQADLEFDYKQAVFTSLRCSNLIVQSLITEYKLNDEGNFIKNIEHLKKIKYISDALYTKFRFIYTIAHKAKYMENEIVTRSEAEMCISSVFTIMSWYVNKKTKNNTKQNVRNKVNTSYSRYDFDFLPKRLNKVKNNMFIAQQGLQKDPENTLIKCRVSMEIIVEDIANQENINLKTDRLYDNIEEIKDILPQDIYFSMQSTRTLGNIGGHKNKNNIEKLRIDANVCLQVTYRTLYWFSKDYKVSKLSDKNEKGIKNNIEQRDNIIQNIKKENNKKVVSSKSNITKSEIKEVKSIKQEVIQSNNSKYNDVKKVFEQWGTSGEYIGYVLNGKRHGQGKMIYTTGDIYNGNWNEDKRDGFGKMRYANGSYYEGEWKNNFKHGKAKRYKLKEGNIYIGEIKKGKLHGKGTMRYINGNVYEGTWNEGRQHGIGKLQYANGDIYIGEFVDDKCHGEGTIRYSDGREYKGKWENNKIVNSGAALENDKPSIGNLIGKLFRV